MAFTYDCIAALRARLAEQPLVEFVPFPRNRVDDGTWTPSSEVWSKLRGY